MSTFDVVSIFDPAIDWAAMKESDAFDAYADSDTARRDTSLLAPFRTGEEPTIYTLRECPQEQWVTFVREGASHHMQAYRALLTCLVSVKDMRSADGLLMGPEFKLTRYPKSEIVRAESITRIPIRQLEDIAEVAFTRSFFQSETAFGYRLQPTLRELHAAWAAHRAAANRSSRAPSSDAASSG